VKTEPSQAVEALRRTPVFSGLEPEELAAVARAVVMREVPKGGLLFEEGDEARGFFLLVSGRMKVFKATPDGREQILHFISPGETFAEVALFAGSSYPATAQALAPSRVAAIPREGLFRLVEKNPQLCLNLLAGFARWVRQFNALLAEYAKAVPARVAGYLLAEGMRQHPGTLADGVRVRLGVNKGELAAHLGTVGETLSRAFARLREDGLVEVEEKEIVIRDLAGLRDLAAGGGP